MPNSNPQDGVFRDGRRDVSIYDFPDRKFGIELEMLDNLDRSHAARVTREALRANGFEPNVNVSGYGHDDNTNRAWHWKTDASCGNELASPVLQGWRGLWELQTVMDAVDSEGARIGSRLVDSRCGVHVHVDCRDHNWQEVKKVVLAMKIWEPLFFAMNPRSRSGNQYCRPMEVPCVALRDATTNERLKDVWENPSRNGSPRYHGLNLCPWWTQGSIEFRYFSGTFAFEKAAGAIMMSVLFIEAVKRKESVRLSTEQLGRRYEDIWQMAGSIGLEEFSERFFRDFLVLKSNSCPAFREFRKFIRSRIATFYENDGRVKRI